MSLYINPKGRGTYGIGICARCSIKFSLEDLSPDPNAPGLMVCRKDLDEFDPWRLAPRTAENVTLAFTRPDEPLTVPEESSGDLIGWVGVRGIGGLGWGWYGAY